MYEQTRLYGRERGMEWVYEGVMFKMGGKSLREEGYISEEEGEEGWRKCMHLYTCAQTINEPHLE